MQICQSVIGRRTISSKVIYPVTPRPHCHPSWIKNWLPLSSGWRAWLSAWREFKEPLTRKSSFQVRLIISIVLCQCFCYNVGKWGLLVVWHLQRIFGWFFKKHVGLMLGWSCCLCMFGHFIFQNWFRWSSRPLPATRRPQSSQSLSTNSKFWPTKSRQEAVSTNNIYLFC